MKTLRAVEAEHLADRPPYTLSGEEKQRAAIISVLIMEPELAFLDEPTASLVPRVRKHIITLLKTLDSTLLIASHHLDMMLDLGSDVTFLHRRQDRRTKQDPRLAWGRSLSAGYRFGITRKHALGTSGRAEMGAQAGDSRVQASKG